MKADEEDELAAEKKKNLQILGSLLNIDLEHAKPTKMATSAKKFKYDPSIIREEGILGRLNFSQYYTTKVSLFTGRTLCRVHLKLAFNSVSNLSVPVDYVTGNYHCGKKKVIRCLLKVLPTIQLYKIYCV